MPWTQKNYPVSMKNLSAPVRKKAIEIANAILKEDKKMKEGIVIATAIKNAEKLFKVKPKSVKAAPKKEAKKKVAAKKSIAAPKKKAKNAPVKKAKAATKKAAKKSGVTKSKSSTKKVDKSKKVKNARASIKPEQKKIVAKKRVAKPKKEVIHDFIIEPVRPEIELKGEDQHFIPKEGEAKPVDTIQIHNFENAFHHREEIAMRQENNKVNAAKASRKNFKRTYRMNGNR